MPYLTIYTNQDLKDGSKIAEATSELAAKILRKPESYVVTNIVYNPNMSFGGSHQNKGALVELKSIGLGDKDRFVSELTDLLAKDLEIKNKQYIAIALIDSPACYTACNGQTFG